LGLRPCLGDGGGGGDDCEPEGPAEGFVGGVELASLGEVGADVVWALLTGGGGGVRGTLSGGIVGGSRVDGLADAGDTDFAGDSGRGAVFPVLVSKPGGMAGSDFSMLSLVFRSGFFESAKHL
jgi:hypothetical protein